MTHDIPEEVKNSNLEYCITEYVRLESHRAILRDRWFLGLSIEQLAEKYYLSETRLKDIVYGIGDRILLKAAKM